MGTSCTYKYSIISCASNKLWTGAPLEALPAKMLSEWFSEGLILVTDCKERKAGAQMFQVSVISVKLDLIILWLCGNWVVSLSNIEKVSILPQTQVSQNN